jgi:RND family efflux transporter MFP subunit
MRLSVAVLLLTSSALASAQMSLEGSPASTGIERQEIRAQLMPRNFTTLAAEIGAKISLLALREGESFSKGQVLLRFDCSMQQAMLQKARAELTAADHTHRTNQRLHELNSVGQLELNLSKASIAKATAEVGVQQAVLSKCSIAAPFSGRITEQRVRDQQYVQPGQALLEIIDDSVLELEFLAPSAWLAWLKPGLPFEIEIDETGKAYPARITRLGARIDPVSQSLKVAATIEGGFPELLAGMSGRVRIAKPAQED